MQEINIRNLKYGSSIYTLILIFFIICFSNTLYAKNSVSPYDYGLIEAETNMDRFWVLYKTHCEANKKGLVVNYKGIDQLTIEIPADAEPIPLLGSCDFRGLRLRVINKTKDLFLFELSQQSKSVIVDKTQIDAGDYTSVPELSKGKKMLLIKDLTPWVVNREGYDYGATRNECILIFNGKAVNQPIMPYNTSQSKPQCSYVEITTQKKVLSNLIFERDSSCTNKTYLMKLYNQYGVNLKNIETLTPRNDTLYEDRIFWVEHCANISFTNCKINGSYSQRRKWGYGIYMDNVYNSSFKNLKTNTNWGVFCTRSMNTVAMKSCQVNRFDTHCYGRDIVCKNCVFTDRECSYTSFYGDIVYKHCVFDDCIPLHIDYSYDAYTPFHLIMKNCTLKPSKRHDSIIMVEYLLEKNRTNRRDELKESHWPCVTINGLKIKTSKDEVSKVFLFKFLKTKYPRNEVYTKDNKLPTDLTLKKIRVGNSMSFFQTNMDFDNEVIN